MNWYLQVLKKYAVFSGRARRKEFWMFFLFNGIIIFALVAAAMAGGSIAGGSEGLMFLFILLYMLYVLAMLIPNIAVSVRRLHDTNRSGWWLLIDLIPFIGGIIILMFMMENSQPGENRYGPNPKATAV